MSRRLLYGLPVLLFAVVAGYFLTALWSDDDPRVIPSALIGKAAPPFDLAALSSGEPNLTAADLRGGPVVINFFASWCVPCRAEHPELLRLAHQPGVRLYGIAYKDKPEATAAFLAELGNPFVRVGVDANGRAGIDYGISGVPETFVLDGNGIVRHRHWGPLTAEAVDEDIMPMLVELGN